MLFRYILITTFLLVTILSNAQSWKTYPYHQSGSAIYFPRDEGYHPGQIIEWWYTNAHLVGDSTGTDYTYVLCYFKYDTLGFDGFRIFDLENESTRQFYPETEPCNYPTLDTNDLNIVANVGFTGATHEAWQTLTDSMGNLIPFQYLLQAASASGSIDVTYNTVDRPLMVGGTGYLYEGSTGYTYYYSQTLVDVSGTITLNGVKEHVHGYAWIDRQWGQFNPANGEKYDWMSIQLSNGTGINLWNIYNAQNQIPDTSTYRFCSIYTNDSTASVNYNFNLQRLKYTYTVDSLCYDQKWNLSYDSTNLLITAEDFADVLSLPFYFFEGGTNITGTVNGDTVTGVGYAELLHTFSNPQLNITTPSGHVTWDGSPPLTWELLNPDGGRTVYYDVEVSSNDKASYTKIAHGLTDTMLNWTPDLANGVEGWFRVTGYSIDSTLSGYKVSDTSFIMGVTGIAEMENEGIIASTYPEPFETYTTLSYELKQEGKLQIDILNMEGRLIKTLYAGFTTAGTCTIEWNGMDGNQTSAPAGVYFYRLQMDKNKVFGKILKMR